MQSQFNTLTQFSPQQAAQQLRLQVDPKWFSRFVDAINTDNSDQGLRRLMQVWDLSQAGAAELFGVSRQALSKWLQRGVPQNRHSYLANLAAANDLLQHYLKPERIPAVVRKPASMLNNRSLLKLAKKGQTQQVLEACRKMFDFSAAQGR